MDENSGPSLTRRAFTAIAALGVMGFGRRPRNAAWSASDRMLYVGTYTAANGSKGIYQLRMSRDTGALSVVALAIETSNPSFLTLSGDERFLYAVNEVGEIDGKKTGGVSAFARDVSTGTLRLLGSQPTNGGAPCYVSIDRSGTCLMVANYTGGSVSAFPIRADGNIGPATSFIQHEGKGFDAQRQTGPHAHSIVADPGNRFALAADLGLDRVFAYSLDARAAKLSPKPAARGVLAPGAGPRHFVFHDNGRVVYVANELNSTLTAFRYDASSGALSELQTLPSVGSPVTGQNAPADIHLHPNGRFLYMSNRGQDTIAVFAIDDATAQLRPIEFVSTGGSWPRNFAIDPSGEFLLVANQRSDTITCFRIDRRSGRLTNTGQSVSVKAPVCIRFVAAE